MRNYSPVPAYIKNTKCHYVPIEKLGSLGDGIIFGCRWGLAQYDRAYKQNEVWGLLWSDEICESPDAIQVRKGFYKID